MAKQFNTRNLNRILNMLTLASMGQNIRTDEDAVLTCMNPGISPITRGDIKAAVKELEALTKEE